MKKNIFYHLGNFLILISLIGFVYALYPILKMYIFVPKVSASLPKTGTYITIPKIHAQAPVSLNVDPWNENVYREVLKKSVAHAEGTSLPGGAQGTTFIFAHSSGMPWEMTGYNTIFLRLGELKKGDLIEIEREGKIYTYKVREKKEVFPYEVNYLLQTKKTQLILQTCTPIGTSLKRLLVFADAT